jgi:hypothetical protein
MKSPRLPGIMTGVGRFLSYSQQPHNRSAGMLGVVWYGMVWIPHDVQVVANPLPP